MSLPGFIEFTHELSDYERSLVPVFIKGFQSKVGKKNAITNKEIILKLAEKGITITEPRVRKIVNVIRNGDAFGEYVLMASSNGYYLTRDENEIIEYAKSLTGRINAIEQVKNSVLSKLKRAS